MAGSGSWAFWSVIIVGAIVATGFVMAISSQHHILVLGRQDAGLKEELHNLSNRQRIDIANHEAVIGDAQNDLLGKGDGEGRESMLRTSLVTSDSALAASSVDLPRAGDSNSTASAPLVKSTSAEEGGAPRSRIVRKPASGVARSLPETQARKSSLKSQSKVGARVEKARGNAKVAIPATRPRMVSVSANDRETLSAKRVAPRIGTR